MKSKRLCTFILAIVFGSTDKKNKIHKKPIKKCGSSRNYSLFKKTFFLSSKQYTPISHRRASIYYWLLPIHYFQFGGY